MKLCGASKTILLTAWNSYWFCLFHWFHSAIGWIAWSASSCMMNIFEQNEMVIGFHSIWRFHTLQQKCWIISDLCREPNSTKKFPLINNGVVVHRMLFYIGYYLIIGSIWDCPYLEWQAARNCIETMWLDIICEIWLCDVVENHNLALLFEVNNLMRCNWSEGLCLETYKAGNKTHDRLNGSM